MCVAVFWTKKLITRDIFFFLHFAPTFVSKMSLLLSPISTKARSQVPRNAALTGRNICV